MRCSRCDLSYTVDDNYCRRCGASLRIQRLPVRRANNLPVPWQAAAPVLVRGAGVLAAGAIGRWALKSMAQRILNGGAPKSRRNTALTKKSQGVASGDLTATEMVIVRKVTVRR